jgi:integrase
MFNFAREEKLVREVPLFKWPKEVKDKLDVERIRFLSFQEYDRLLTCCPDWLKDIVTVAAWTGLRQRNVLELKRNEVNLAQRAIYIEGEQVKNGEDQGKPIPGPAYEALSRRMKAIDVSGSSYVLGDEHGRPYHKQKVHRHFKKAVKKAGITDFRFHDLRHCYGSWNAQNGVDLLPLSLLLGHKDLRMTRRYSHLNTASLLKAVAPLEKSYGSRVTN